MDVSPKTLREVEFREKMRGYHPEDVDHFLEEVAAGLEMQQERLRQAVERAQRAEAAASEAGGNDEVLRKTLVLAQRTADLAVQEAREQAARILAGAEQQAQAMLADADERGRRTLEDATADSRTELARLETARAQAQQDVDTLNRWLEEHKAHLLESLAEATAAVERAGVLWAAPSTRPIDVAGYPPLSRLNPSPAPPSPDSAGLGPDTALWTPPDDDRLESSATPGPGPGPGVGPGSAPVAPPAPPAPPPAAAAPPPSDPPPAISEANNGPNDQALDDFFEDSDELGDDRRFGGRLRRRR
jgi:DivIVA domain-containing protein